MRGWLSRVALIFVLLVSHTTSGIPLLKDHRNTNKRAVFGGLPSLSTFRGGVLVKNGRQTACELALIDSSSAFVAASCLDTQPGVSGTRYEVYFDGAAGKNSGGSAPILSANIYVHPRYDAATYANNVAVVQYAISPQQKWSSSVAANRDEWTNALFVRRYLSDLGSTTWGTPEANTGAWAGDVDCAAASGIYAANQRDFMCSAESSPIVLSSTCGIPYSSVYGAVSQKMAVAALHSHSVVVGDALCGSQKTLHYYTILAGYLGFAQMVIGKSVKFFTATSGFTPTIDASYAMAPALPISGIGDGAAGRMRSFTGDMFNPGSGTVVDTTGPAPPPQVSSASPSSPPPPPPPGGGGNNNVPGAVTSSALDTPQSLPLPGAASPSPVQSLSPASTAAAVADGSGNSGTSLDPNQNPAPSSNALAGGTALPAKSVATATATAAAAAGGGNGGKLTATAGLGGIKQDSNNNGVQTMDAGNGSPGIAIGSGGGSTSDNEESDGGLKSGQIVAIGIFVPIAAIGLLVGAYFGLRWYRRQRLEKSWKGSDVQQIVETQMTENELGLSSGSENFNLPSYRNHSDTMLIATSPRAVGPP
ncbi:hypothetical protein GGI04_000712 [Coemansia thaxteri]|uniref:Peptidase S1 domain-containing protein n=1 Tax=Coemansia thaxteri TaxID=2663907 RepID=A0A9W8BJR9_9FUNG|nr:hypothetical protein H4R26_000676 [Coemansia thaxteri]KAJ2009111.1 hypothetical protein GGI04_000712 [Coemansia thaxteri]KAJ2474044.1 hypothetical protein GGI02_000390 [Coemansia sp. RSA 2322]KAJ2486930.1 hypothetical protein EV174_000830 [Coemansia sp. RSA 2320]